jgi:phosphoribosylglycinamide formyltransferase-1
MGYYGLKVHEAALDYGVKVTGATVHYVDNTVDGGEIIAQKAVEVLPGDTPRILQKLVMKIGVVLFYNDFCGYIMPFSPF